eukprot:1876037-Amphidinium_carterae.1
MIKKLQEKELVWDEIDPIDRPLYLDAMAKEWREWLDLGCVEVLGLEESKKVREAVSKRRILKSDFKLKDKKASIRTPTNMLPTKAKARLCVAGQHEPDAQQGPVRTDAPTMQR